MPEPTAPVTTAVPTTPVAPAPITAPVAPAPAVLNTPPAPGTPAPPTTPVAPNVPPDMAWTNGMPEDIRGYIATKGFKDTTAVVQSYQNLEKLMGVPRENLLSLPEKADSPDWANVYKRLGKPEKASDYKINAPEGADATFTDWAKGTFHELNLTSTQAENLSTKWNEFMEKANTNHKGALEREQDAQESALRTEWGLAYDKNINAATKAANSLGIDATKIEALEGVLGFEGIMKMMHTIGSKYMKEGDFELGNGPASGSVMTPAQALVELEAVRQDPVFTKNYAAGGKEEREKMDYLHKMAYPPNAVPKVLG